MYLFFDTETTGLPRNWKAPVDDFENWPRLVQIAWLVYDEQKVLQEKHSYIITPENFTIPEEAANVHGISTDKAWEEGVDLYAILEKFVESSKKCDFLVAHNIAFDEKIICCELLRKQIFNNIDQMTKKCTMLASVNLCKLPGHYGYKWPKLIELYKILFGIEFDNAHDALADIEACADCFWKLKTLHFV
jgi:DNA polymerase-3 subunit epsilon